MTAEIPEAAIEAAASILLRDYPAGPDATWRDYKDDVRDILAAAEPALRAHIAGQIVWQIHAIVWEIDDGDPRLEGFYYALRVAADMVADFARRVGGADAGGGE